MNKIIRGVLVWFVVGFIIGLIFTRDIKISFTTGIIVIILFLLIRGGVLRRFLFNIGGEIRRLNDKVIDHDKKAAAWKNKVYQERVLEGNREAGRQRAKEDFKKRELIRKEQERKRRNFMNNPLGIGR